MTLRVRGAKIFAAVGSGSAPGRRARRARAGPLPAQSDPLVLTGRLLVPQPCDLEGRGHCSRLAHRCGLPRRLHMVCSAVHVISNIRAWLGLGDAAPEVA